MWGFTPIPPIGLPLHSPPPSPLLPPLWAFFQLLELTKLAPTSEPLPLLFLLPHIQMIGSFLAANLSKNVNTLERPSLTTQLKDQPPNPFKKLHSMTSLLYCFHSTSSHPYFHLLFFLLLSLEWKRHESKDLVYLTTITSPGENRAWYMSDAQQVFSEWNWGSIHRGKSTELGVRRPGLQREMGCVLTARLPLPQDPWL